MVSHMPSGCLKELAMRSRRRLLRSVRLRSAAAMSSSLQFAKTMSADAADKEESMVVGA